MATIEQLMDRLVAMEHVAVQQRAQIEQFRAANATARALREGDADLQRAVPGVHAEQRVDTKLFGKPDKFSGEWDDNSKYKDGVPWESWSFVLAACCIAVFLTWQS